MSVQKHMTIVLEAQYAQHIKQAQQLRLNIITMISLQ
jgi:hypothetical protein